MPYLANPTSLEKNKITLKMQELTDAQQLQEFLAAKQQAAAEENKRKKREYTFYYWALPVFSLIFGALSLGLKGNQIYNDHLVNKHSLGVILRDFFVWADYNFAFYVLLFTSLLPLWLFSYIRKELKKLNQSENPVYKISVLNINQISFFYYYF